MGKNIVKIKTILILLGLLFSCTVISLAGQIPEGIWYQTSSTAGDCPNCEIVIKKITPHILFIEANNGWVGYAYYIQSKDMYKGVMEWKAGKGGTYENQVFQIELIYEGNTLTKRAHGAKLDFITTYRKK